MFATGAADDGVSVFSLAANGTLTNVTVAGGNVTDAGALELDGARFVTTAVLNSVTYLFVAGIADDGLSVFSINNTTGALTNVDNETNAGGGSFLGGCASLAVVTVSGSIFLYAAGSTENGFTLFSVNQNTGQITGLTGFAADDGLDGVSALHTAAIGSSVFFSAGTLEDAINVYSIDAMGSPTKIDKVVDGGNRELNAVAALTTAVVAGKTFLFAAAQEDHGVSVFEVSAEGFLTNVFNVTDDATLKLFNASALATAAIAGTTYLFAAGFDDDGVSVFGVAPDGTLVNVANISDAGSLELSGPSGLTTTVVGGNTYLTVAGADDSGLSVFRVDATGLDHQRHRRQRHNQRSQLGAGPARAGRARRHHQWPRRQRHHRGPGRRRHHQWRRRRRRHGWRRRRRRVWDLPGPKALATGSPAEPEATAS